MDYTAIIQEAELAAAEAAEKWLEAAMARGPAYSVHSGGQQVGTMLDVCGFAWLEFKDRRSAFYKHCKKVENAYRVSQGARPDRQLHRVPIGGEYDKWRGHQEMGMKEDAMRAAQSVFSNYGIITHFRSRID